MFIGIKDSYDIYVINVEGIESIRVINLKEGEWIGREYILKESYGIIMNMKSGDVIKLEWEKSSDRNKMMSYLYGQLVSPELGSGHPNRFIGAEDL